MLKLHRYSCKVSSVDIAVVQYRKKPQKQFQVIYLPLTPLLSVYVLSHRFLILQSVFSLSGCYVKDGHSAEETARLYRGNTETHMQSGVKSRKDPRKPKTLIASNFF